MNQQQLENFYQSITTYPLNMEQVILQIGHKCDFIQECSMFNLVVEYIKVHNVDTTDNITSEIYNQFSHFINAPQEEDNKMKTRLQKEEEAFSKSMKNMNFKDIGDMQTVQLPVAQLDRFQVNFALIQHLEKELRLDSQKDIKERIQKISEIEIKREKQLEKYFEKIPNFYNTYLKPVDLEKYCYQRALCLFYFSFITDTDQTLDSYHTSVEIMSYLNFLYPNGNPEEFAQKIDQNKFNQELLDIANFIPQKNMKELLAQLRTDKEHVIENAKKEIEQEKQLSENIGLLE